MRVMIWPAGERNVDGTSMARLFLPGDALIAQGADVVFDTTGPKCMWNTDWSDRDSPPAHARIIRLMEKPDCDVIVMQRPGRRWWADVIPMLQEKGVRVVVDVDDLFDNIDRANVAHSYFDPQRNSAMNHEWIDAACRVADVVTSTTPLLHKRYGHGHGRLIPNFVPERYLSIDARKRQRTVGWSGTVMTHPKDLRITGGMVGRVLKEQGWNFYTVGPPEGVREALDLPKEPKSPGWVGYEHYADAVAHMEVGIVPLDDTPFNNAKSCLKLIEFSALGIPTLATATEDNLRMFNLGVGSIVKHPHHWYKRLHKMVTDENHRKEVAERSRAVMRDHTYEKNCWRWADAWGLK